MTLCDGEVIDIAVKAPKMCLLTQGAVVDFYKEAKQIRMQGAPKTGCSNFYSNIKEFTILVIVK